MDRDRLTITLRKDILKKVDQLIDGTSIRNRSHAIETLISRSMMPKIDTALILAGGKDIWLKPLESTVNLLKNNGITNIIFTIGPKGNKIRSFFGDGSKFGVRIRYSEERNRLGTAGSLRNASHLISGSFVTIHGDILTKINLLDLLNFHSQQNLTATMALTTAKDIETHGNVSLQGTKIRQFHEKPKASESLSLLINAGVYVFEPSIFSYIPKTGPSFLEEEIFPKLAQEGQLSGFSFSEQWVEKIV